MDIPVTLFGILVGGLLAGYAAILHQLFDFSRGLEADFRVAVQNVKTRDISRIRDFMNTETSDARSETELEAARPLARNGDHRAKGMMEKTWKNAYSCYKAEELVDKLHRREAAGQKWCIVGIISTVVSFFVYLLPSQSLATVRMCAVLFLCFFPLFVVASFFFGNLSIRSDIRSVKRELEGLWQF